MELGPVGIVLKHAAGPEPLKAIDHVARGHLPYAQAAGGGLGTNNIQGKKILERNNHTTKRSGANVS